MEAPLRIMAIVQLCLAFTLICWNLAIPFMGDHFLIQRKMKLVEAVVTDSTRFNHLPSTIQEEILHLSQNLSQEIATPFLMKLQKSLWQLLIALPPFELAWIVFGIALAIMILKKRPELDRRHGYCL